MQRYMISVMSITYAIKGRDALRKNGIKVYIEKKVNINGNAGCGYVIIAYGNKNKITHILMQSNIKIIEIKSIT